MVRNRRKDTWSIVVNASEVQTIPAERAAKGDQLAWKTAMWGSARDEKFIKAVSKRFPRLITFAQERKIHIHEGFQLREKGHLGIEFIEELLDKKLLDMNVLRNCKRIFMFPPHALGTITQDHAYLRTRGGKRGLHRFPAAPCNRGRGSAIRRVHQRFRRRARTADRDRWPKGSVGVAEGACRSTWFQTSPCISSSSPRPGGG